MHIEVFQLGDDRFHYHTVNGNHITTDTESFASESNAKRAAKALVTAMLKPVGAKPLFQWTEGAKLKGHPGVRCLKLEWWRDPNHA